MKERVIDYRVLGPFLRNSGISDELASRFMRDPMNLNGYEKPVMDFVMQEYWKFWDKLK